MRALRHYFAYGSNMNTARVAERGLETVSVVRASLHGFRLTFDKASMAHPDCGHANIRYAPGEVVEGALYKLASPDEILKMDPFERAPINYGRDGVVVCTESGDVPAWTYFANAHAIREGLLPPRSYLEHLLAGEAFLSPAYFAALQRHPAVENL